MEVLKKLYPRTFTLSEYLEGVGCPDLIQPRDKVGFRSFVQTTILAEIDGTLQLEEPVSFRHCLHQAEVVTKSVQVLKTRCVAKNKNVLLFGKSQTNEWCVPESNQTLVNMPHWELLLARIGDDVMLHLLVNLSVFLFAPPSCYIQVCGFPICDLISRPGKILHHPNPSGNSSDLASVTFPMASVCHRKKGCGRLPKTHRLECLPASNSGAKKLMSSILTEQKLTKNGRSKISRTRRRFVPMQNLLKDILAAHKKTNVTALLDAHCPTPSHGVTCERSLTLQDLLNDTNEPWRVFLFLRGVLIRAVPFPVWGSMHNRQAFFKFVEKFVKLGRTEKLDLEQLMKKINVQDCDWTRLKKLGGRSPCRSDALMQEKMVSSLLAWIMSDYIMALVRTAFYVTETSSRRNGVVYYRKSTWNMLEKMGIEQCVASGILKPITHKLAENLISSEATLGCSSLRLVPKPKGLRPITNMRQPAAGKQGITINNLLEDVCDVLSFHRSQEPSCLGSSLFSVNEAYEKWKQFVVEYRQQDARPLYFVKVDINQSYDSIPHLALYDVITQLLKLPSKNQLFTIHRYAAVTCNLRRTYCRRTYLEEGCHMTCHQILLQQAQEERWKNAVLVNRVWSQSTTAQHAMALLKKHVGCDIVKFGGRHYLRKKGIPQGSIVSSLLCNYFYAAMETECLPPIGQDELMLRLIDDFLLVTPNLEKAKGFLTVLLNGLPKYGCQTNRTKTLTNFPFVFDGQQIQSIGQSELFPWCGLLFNTENLEVCNDFTRYKDVSIRYTMSLDSSGDVISKVKTKLIQAMQAKCAGFFLDPQINSFLTVRRNCYEMLLMCAFRFHSLLRALPHHFKTSKNVSRELLGVIFRLIDKMHRVGCPLKKSETKWLCLTAFQTKLQIHQSSYRRLLKLIKKTHRKVSRYMVRADKETLELACSPALPQAFKAMKT
ncbi:telomerase reverse transcriptase-like [Patiria miniata]|uniref:Telomerase reverse transcriptase n=1 Tax=Patiria miniata TaxID=46514 RepID=A0A913ZHK7_PATMI|nr:telomerase reverse transcriptase-like [Patiria miniata]